MSDASRDHCYDGDDRPRFGGSSRPFEHYIRLKIVNANAYCESRTLWVFLLKPISLCIYGVFSCPPANREQ